MDISVMFGSIIDQLWWLAALIVVGTLLKTPWFKGYLGELMVRLSARLLLDKDIYHAIHNVTLKTQDGTTQIDHIFVSRFGIFVVETKNYSGWIFGGQNEATWTQKHFKSTHRFQNPLRQNYKHVKTLESLLNVPPEKIFSVIVFVGGSTFKTPMPENVTFAGAYIKYIKSKNQIIFTDSNVEKIYLSISDSRITPSFATNQEHISSLKQRLEKDDSRKCPKCSSEMTLRIVKSGEKAGSKFWGCTQFPRCRGIRNHGQ